MHVLGPRAPEQRGGRPGQVGLLRPDAHLEGFRFVVRRGDAAFVSAEAKVMEQRVHVRGAHLGVLRQVVGRVEVRADAAPLGPPREQVVEERVHAVGADVRVGVEVVPRAEEGVGVAAFVGAPERIVFGGIAPRRGDGRVVGEVPGLVDEAAVAQPVGDASSGLLRLVSRSPPCRRPPSHVVFPVSPGRARFCAAPSSGAAP